MSLIHIHSNKSNSYLIKDVGPDAIQPNAVDLCIDRVWKMDGFFVLGKNSKVNRNRVEIDTNEFNEFHLEANQYYEISFSNNIKIGEDEAGWVIPRSTLIRNGISIVTGLYDSGYEGAMAAGLLVNIDTAFIERGARIGQFLLFKAESLHQYDGSYGVVGGKAKEDEKRYHE